MRTDAPDLASPQCRRVETPALDPAVRAAWPMKPVEPSPYTAERESGAEYVARERSLRVVKILRILEAAPHGESVDELCRVFGATSQTIARDLDLLVDADEPLMASGPLAARETRVTLARDGDG